MFARYIRVIGLVCLGAVGCGGRTAGPQDGAALPVDLDGGTDRLSPDTPQDLTLSDGPLWDLLSTDKSNPPTR